MAKVLKNPINYEISLDEFQKQAKDSIINGQITIITGGAGTGKTSCTVQAAVDLLFKKEISKILVTRPIVEVGKSLGFLPGELNEKYNPYIEPVLDSLYNCYRDKEKIRKMLEEKKVEGYPIAYIRGKNMNDFLIVDEAQNLSELEIRAICTRLTPHGKIVFVGDIDQNDTGRSFTGLHYLLEMANSIPEIHVHNLKNNHRSDLVAKILTFDRERQKRTTKQVEVVTT